MELPEGYDFEKLSREIVTQRLADINNAPAAAAEIARKIIVSGVTATQAGQEPRITVIQVCRGIISGMMFIGKDLPETAVALLNILDAVALEVRLDPNSLMTWAMQGIADIVPIIGRQARSDIQESIEGRFMGAGAVFDELCDKAMKDAGKK